MKTLENLLNLDILIKYPLKDHKNENLAYLNKIMFLRNFSGIQLGLSKKELGQRATASHISDSSGTQNRGTSDIKSHETISLAATLGHLTTPQRSLKTSTDEAQHATRLRALGGSSAPSGTPLVDKQSELMIQHLKRVRPQSLSKISGETNTKEFKAHQNRRNNKTAETNLKINSTDQHALRPQRRLTSTASTTVHALRKQKQQNKYLLSVEDASRPDGHPSRISQQMQHRFIKNIYGEYLKSRAYEKFTQSGSVGNLKPNQLVILTSFFMLSNIFCQIPQIIKSKKAIATFNVRKNLESGLILTLRRKQSASCLRNFESFYLSFIYVYYPQIFSRSLRNNSVIQNTKRSRNGRLTALRTQLKSVKHTRISVTKRRACFNDHLQGQNTQSVWQTLRGFSHKLKGFGGRSTSSQISKASWHFGFNSAHQIGGFIFSYKLTQIPQYLIKGDSLNYWLNNFFSFLFRLQRFSYTKQLTSYCKTLQHMQSKNSSKSVGVSRTNMTQLKGRFVTTPKTLHAHRGTLHENLWLNRDAYLNLFEEETKIITRFNSFAIKGLWWPTSSSSALRVQLKETPFVGLSLTQHHGSSTLKTNGSTSNTEQTLCVLRIWKTLHRSSVGISGPQTGKTLNLLNDLVASGDVTALRTTNATRTQQDKHASRPSGRLQQHPEDAKSMRDTPSSQLYAFQIYETLWHFSSMVFNLKTFLFSSQFLNATRPQHSDKTRKTDTPRTLDVQHASQTLPGSSLETPNSHQTSRHTTSHLSSVYETKGLRQQAEHMLGLNREHSMTLQILEKSLLDHRSKFQEINTFWNQIKTESFQDKTGGHIQFLFSSCFSQNTSHLYENTNDDSKTYDGIPRLFLRDLSLYLLNKVASHTHFTYTVDPLRSNLKHRKTFSHPKDFWHITQSNTAYNNSTLCFYNDKDINNFIQTYFLIP